MVIFFIHLVPAVALSFLFQLIMHEMGHMVGGLISGWRFIFLQVGNIVMYMEDNKLRFKKVDAANYQCVMYPITAGTDATAYTLGGSVMNLILTLAALPILVTQKENMTLWFYSWCMLMFGIGMILSNAVPNTKRICNDMACFLLLRKDAFTRECHNTQFLIARRLWEGNSYREVGGQFLCHTNGMADNDILAYNTVLELYYSLDNGDVAVLKDITKTLESAFKKILHNTSKNAPVSQSVFWIIGMELFYLELLERIKNFDDSSFDSERYGSDVEGYLKVHLTKGDVHSIRVKYAYDAYKSYFHGDIWETADTLNRGIVEIRQTASLYCGEAVFCIRQLQSWKHLMGVE